MPAHDEEKLIAETIRSIPYFVDRIYRGRRRLAATARSPLVRALDDERVELIEHERNRGVGAAIVTGYQRALEERIDVTAVMAADAQMDPADLETLCRPGRARRGRLREGEPALHRPGLGGDPALPLPRERAAQPADEDRLGLLARRRLAVRLHGGLARVPRAARPRPALPALRLPERPARPPERLERARARLPVTADLRRRRALGDPAAQGRADDLLAAVQGLLVAACGRST